ncbi:MAG: winged helix-turn-helix domain-containing protein [Proteobacteria bacterium]|nr:winged helix-turn-helix domain-containing protein [Pseudomonadota bacterium]
MSTLAVVEEILRETRFPMSVRQIVEHAAGRLPTRSKTPDTVVARDLSMDIKKKGEASLFIRTAPGRYTLREIYLENLAQEPAQQGDQDWKPEDDHGKGDATSVLSSAIRSGRAGPLAAKKTPGASSGDSPDQGQRAGS